MSEEEFHSLTPEFLPLVKCQLCQSKVKEAKILMCGLFCNNCVVEFEKNANKISKEFKCKSCHQNHKIPINGFVSWNSLNKFNTKESSFENLYIGETAEKLKRNLKEIKTKIDYLDFSLKSSLDLVKQICINLKNEINLEAQIVIKKIQDARDELVQEVFEYEQKFKLNIQEKQEIYLPINEIKEFHKEWSEYLQRNQNNEIEMIKANKFALELQERLNDQIKNFEKMIFNNKSISFKKKQVDIQKNFLGNLDYKEIGEIDFNKFQIVKLTDILSNLDSCYARHIDIDSFENGKIAVVYPDIYNRVSIAIIDKNRNIIKSSQTNFYVGTIHCKIKFKTAKKFLIIFHMDDHGVNYLSLLNSYLQVITSSFTLYEINSLCANEKNIYGLSKNPDLKIIVFDYQLHNIKNFGQSLNLYQVCYLNKQIMQIAQKNNTFYCLYPERIDIIDESTGFLIKTVSIEGNKMAFDSQSVLLVLSVGLSKIFKFNLNGILQDEINLKNVPIQIDFSIDQEDQIFYFNKLEKCIYFD